jgi:hypothetical protein
LALSANSIFANRRHRVPIDHRDSEKYKDLRVASSRPQTGWKAAGLLAVSLLSVGHIRPELKDGSGMIRKQNRRLS